LSTSVVSRRYVVSGRVQGVGFRWFVREQARGRGLAGFVQNAADGSVIAHVSGGAEGLAALEGALRVGPPGAQVSHLDITALDPGVSASLPAPFEIRR